MNRKNKWFWIIGGIVALLIIWFGLRWWNRDVVTIKAGLVSRGTIEAVVSASGFVDAPVYELGTKIGGRIAVLNVKEGAKVKKRQLLATFDNYEQARSDYESALDLYEQGAASRQQYEAAKTIFEASRIVAPNDGLVAKVNYWEGETVVPGSAAITVVNYDKSWVEAQIDEIDIAGVKIGDKVKVTSDVYPDKTFAGEIYWIAPLAELRKVGGRVKLDEESYVFPCKIKFLGDHNELKINMSVNVDVTTKVSRDTLVMPREAMFSKDDSQTVFIVNGNRVKQRLIQPGIRSFTSIEVISGLNEGEKVALNNQAKLKDNGRVKIEQ